MRPFEEVPILQKLNRLLDHQERIMTAIDDLNKSVSDLTTAVTNIVGALSIEVAALKAAADTINDPAVAAAAASIETLVEQLNAAASVVTPVAPAPAA
jgi:ABC-type transporter Mla subunit MlaD